MGLTVATLKNGLVNMAPTMSEATAINNFAVAWKAYFAEALAGVIPIADEDLLDPAIVTMKGAMTGLSVAGAASIQAGITAFWGAVTPIAATLWVAVPPALSATQPAGLSGIAASLNAVFLANKTGNLNLDNACQAIAAAIHATQTGGLVTYPTPDNGGIGPQTIV